MRSPRRRCLSTTATLPARSSNTKKLMGHREIRAYSSIWRSARAVCTTMHECRPCLGATCANRAPLLFSDDKRDVDAALGAIRMLIGTVSLTVNEPGATVQIDGEPAGTTPLEGPVVQNLGKHKLSIVKPGFSPVDQTVDIAGGKQTSLTIRLEARAAQSRADVVRFDDRRRRDRCGGRHENGPGAIRRRAVAWAARGSCYAKRKKPTKPRSIFAKARCARRVLPSKTRRARRLAMDRGWGSGGGGSGSRRILLVQPKDETLGVPPGKQQTCPSRPCGDDAAQRFAFKRLPRARGARDSAYPRMLGKDEAGRGPRAHHCPPTWRRRQAFDAVGVTIEQQTGESTWGKPPLLEDRLPRSRVR